MNRRRDMLSMEKTLTELFSIIKDEKVFYLGIDTIEVGESYYTPVDDQEVKELTINNTLLNVYNDLIEYAFNELFYRGKTLGKHIKENNGDYISHFMFQQDDIGFYPLVVFDAEDGMEYLPFVK